MRTNYSLATFALLSLTLAACSRKPEPQTPTQAQQPTQPSSVGTQTGGGATAPTGPSTDPSVAANAVAAALRSELQELIFFDYDVATLRDDAKATLDRKVAILRNNPQVTLRIEGHADERGSVEYNLALSLRRANAIREYLANFQMAANRFEVVPLGEERPLSMGTSESDYARNRRGEFHIVSGGNDLRR